MSEPYLAEIRIFSFDFAPRGYAFCDGQILPINQNQSLYSLLGTTYGGDGRTSFALPDLRGRTPIHVGNSSTQGSTSHTLGQKGGEENAPLTVAQMPAHRHTVRGRAAADNAEAEDEVLGQGEANIYRSPGTNVAMRAGIVANSGSGQGHPNMQPFLAIRFAIAIRGIFPPRN
jgi:microcystin-dependent protein